MRTNRPSAMTSPFLQRDRGRARRGEASTQTVVIIILAVVGAVMLLACVGLVTLGLVSYRQQGMAAGRVPAQRARSQNNLKMLGLAVHNYHDMHRQFPPGGIYDEEETAYHSLQTMILPYMEQAPLYSQIDFDRPWDDQSNSGWFMTPIPQYQHPGLAGESHDAAGFAVSHYAGNSRLFLPNGTNAMRDVTDGLSNTIMAGEVSAGFKPWGDPANLRDPALGFGPGAFSGPPEQNGTVFLLSDGAVRFVSHDIDPDVMEALATPDGGEVVREF